MIRDDEELTLKKSVSLSLAPLFSPLLSLSTSAPHHCPLSSPLVFVCFGFFAFYGGQLNNSIFLIWKKIYVIKIHNLLPGFGNEKKNKQTNKQTESP